MKNIENYNAEKYLDEKYRKLEEGRLEWIIPNSKNSN